ncbi:MAG: DUF202 domain-containing protein [Leptolyngbyaceae cyanobacterium MAG.088]|nr:DUF202 domain-containing protein [Leptolyngbyaceae cyanobacterium MAG.088]
MTFEPPPSSPEDSQSRDSLARDRTLLANERTLLAYVRTSIMLFASGITLVKLFVDDAQSLQALGYMLFPLSLITGLVGYRRFAIMRRKIIRRM